MRWCKSAQFVVRLRVIEDCILVINQLSTISISRLSTQYYDFSMTKQVSLSCFSTCQQCATQQKKI